MIGRDLGNYRIIRELAHGGMGIVYVGEHREIGELVAIKVLKRSLTDDPKLLERVRREARSVHLISGDGVVKTRDMGTLADGTTYIVMELLSGESLFDRLQRQGGRFSVPLAMEITQQIAHTMTAVHAKGLVHRDLKPENLFLTKAAVSGRADEVRTKILDFGLVKLRSPTTSPAGQPQPTAEGVLVGTYRYMAPEQFFSAKDVDGKADVYSLGIILFQMLAGRLPFDETDAIALAIWHSQMAPPSLSQLLPDLPAEAADLVAHMLAKSPAARPTMRDVERQCLHLLGKSPDLPPFDISTTRWLRAALATAGAAALVSTGLLIERHVGSRPSTAAGRTSGATAGPVVTVPMGTPVSQFGLNNGRKGEVRCPLVTVPAHAIIRRADDRLLIGETPMLHFILPDGAPLKIRVQLPGYSDEVRTLDQEACNQGVQVQLRPQARADKRSKSTQTDGRRLSAGQQTAFTGKSEATPPKAVSIDRYGDISAN